MAGRTVLVTGGSSGIGRATAVGLARLGADVAITGRDRASVRLACDPAVEHVSGRYLAGSKSKRSARRSYDEAAAKRLWYASSELVGVP